MSLEEQFASHLDQQPQVHATAYIAPGAILVGDVELHENSSVWYNCTLRGDINKIVIGPGSNVQDNSVVHLADDYGAFIGSYVTCGHLSMIHACTIDDECLIGMGATVMDGAEIGARSIIGANALVTQHSIIPPGSMVLGSPAKVVRSLSKEEQAGLKSWAAKYVQVSRRFLASQPKPATPTVG